MANSRDYAALPHEYLEEMAELPDAAFGRLMRALIRYSRDGDPIQGKGSERFYAVRVMAREDRYQLSYREQGARKRSAAMARWHKTEADGTMQNDAEPCSGVPTDAEACHTETEAETETETKTKTKTEAEAEERERPRTHGAYGWVMLTEGQTAALRQELGAEELERCIAYVDESAQATGNRNHWRDWELVVRRCSREGWGLQQRSARLEREAEASRRREAEEMPSLEELDRILEKIAT